MLVETSSGNLYRIKVLIQNDKGKTLFPKEIPKQDYIDLSGAVRVLINNSLQKTPS